MAYSSGCRRVGRTWLDVTFGLALLGKGDSHRYAPEQTDIDCTCSTGFPSQHKNLKCKECTVRSCSMSDPDMAWPLFSDLQLGECCPYSWSASSYGCGHKTLNVHTARGIVAGAIVLSHLPVKNASQIRDAYLVQTADRSVWEDITASFTEARIKEPEASGSGSTFYYPSNDRYILKSVDSYEYHALFTLTQRNLIDFMSGRVPWTQPNLTALDPTTAASLSRRPLADREDKHKSMITTYYFAFQFAGEYWLVMQNAVTLIGEMLEKDGHTILEPPQVFDIKPICIPSSKDRPKFFGTHLANRPKLGWANYHHVMRTLAKDSIYLETTLDYPLVDWSVLVSMWHLKEGATSLSHSRSKYGNCISTTASSIRGYEGSHSCGIFLICFTIIDILMEFGYNKEIENICLSFKWSSWSASSVMMVHSFMDPTSEVSTSLGYAALHTKWTGVDFWTTGTACAKEMSIHKLDDRFPPTISTLAFEGKHFTCCCDDKGSLCSLVQSGEDSKCGDLKGDGWRSFRRLAKHCFVTSDNAMLIKVPEPEPPKVKPPPAPARWQCFGTICS